MDASAEKIIGKNLHWKNIPACLFFIAGFVFNESTQTGKVWLFGQTQGASVKSLCTLRMVLFKVKDCYVFFAL